MKTENPIRAAFAARQESLLSLIIRARTGATVRRTIHPEVRVLDEKAGLCEYVASDETLDSYNEVIRADGWRFDRFRKNAPFVDSHDYYTVENLLGQVVDFKVDGRRLVETVKWAIDVPENTLAALGWAMTKGGYLKAVSVGFEPTKMVSKWDRDPNPFQQACEQMGLDDEVVNAVYLEQQQLELSSCIIGANPNALAKAYKAGAVSDSDLETISRVIDKRTTADAADSPGAVATAKRLVRERFLGELNKMIKKL